jgi:hypothetical protein
MRPRSLLSVAGALMGLAWMPVSAAGQVATSDPAPLFRSHEPVAVTLRVDIETLRGERSDTTESDGTLLVAPPDGAPFEVTVKVRTRGHFRREARNCSFPPLRLNVPKGAVEGTILEGQDKFKLVTPCRENRDSYQDLVFREFLAYRTLNLFTPASYRVRLLAITYEDPSGERDPIVAYAFAIEDDEAMAARNRGELSVWEQFHPATMDSQQAWTVALFQFMIGNTDWEASNPFHNMDMIRDDLARYLIVPFDFDFSGIVDAPYASPDPIIGIRSVRERRFRGFCRDDVDQDALRRLFLDRRPEVTALWEGFDLLSEGGRNRALDYLETFYRVVENDALYRRQIADVCRPMPR